MSALIWVHEDCLRATHRLFGHAPDGRAVFIWDDAHMTAMHYGLKRRVFIYETLCQLPVEIYVGDIAASLVQLAEDGQEIMTGKTPNPALKHIMQTLRQDRKVSAIADAPFVQMDSPPDLRRFFKYWNKAKKHAFSYDGRA